MLLIEKEVVIAGSDEVSEFFDQPSYLIYKSGPADMLLLLPSVPRFFNPKPLNWSFKNRLLPSSS